MAEPQITIYHNPRCGKSRAALALLQERGITPQIVEYLKTPLDRESLTWLVRQLAIRPEALVRKGEDLYKQRYAGKTLSDAQWIEAMVEHPILMERPVVVRGDRAVVGRPPEKVLELLGS
ncbi:MAG TPA: arsenate reductase (glutaredoxin) [Burkholderiales bacterium]|nr:arsenate reductase (glutaredoxin) [Burkholderiales bacterium]